MGVYCEKEGDTHIVLPLLKQLIEKDASFLEQARKEQTLIQNPQLTNFLDEVYTHALNNAEKAVRNAENDLKHAAMTVNNAQRLATKVEKAIESYSLYLEAEKHFTRPQQYHASGEYPKLLQIPSLCQDVSQLSAKAKAKASTELIPLREKRNEQLQEEFISGLKALGIVAGGILGIVIIFFILANIKVILIIIAVIVVLTLLGL